MKSYSIKPDTNSIAVTEELRLQLAKLLLRTEQTAVSLVEQINSWLCQPKDPLIGAHLLQSAQEFLSAV